MPICRLCLQEKPLCLSHIIPNFFTKQIKNESGVPNKYLVLDAKKKGSPGRGQGGVKEKLFCKECEALLNEQYEKYAYNLLCVSGFEYITSHNKKAKTAININYTKFKLFLLSILFRTSIANHAFCSIVNIGHKHENIIRNMLLYGDAKLSYEYPILIFRVLRKGEVIEDWVMQPARSRLDNHICYQFILGSYMYLFIVSSHRINRTVDEYSLSDKGSAVIFDQDLEKITNVMRLIKRVLRNSKAQ